MRTERSGRSLLRSKDNVQLSGERLCFRHNFCDICRIQSELLVYKKKMMTGMSYHVKVVNTSTFCCPLSKEGFGCSLETRFYSRRSIGSFYLKWKDIAWKVPEASQTSKREWKTQLFHVQCVQLLSGYKVWTGKKIYVSALFSEFSRY